MLPRRREMGRLVGGIWIDGPGEHRGIVGDDRHAAPTDPTERSHDRCTEGGLHLEQTSPVDDHVENGADLVGPTRVRWDHVEDLIEFSGACRRSPEPPLPSTR